jgi:hypothetical protein
MSFQSLGEARQNGGYREVGHGAGQTGLTLPRQDLPF